MSEALRDQNHVPTALGVSSVDGVTTLPFKVDPVTGRLLVDIPGGGSGYTNLTQFIDQTPWRLFYSDGAGDVIELALGSSGTFLKSTGASSAPIFDSPSGAGDVVGPASSTDNALARFDTTTGKLLQNGTISASDVATGAVTLATIGNNDLILATGNATTGNITIFDGANGDIQLNPDGIGSVIVPTLKAETSGGILFEASNGTDVGIFGVGNTANVEWSGSHNFALSTQDTIAAFTGAGKTLGSLALATYPSLTELSYVKGVTSAIQTQLNGKRNLATATNLGNLGATETIDFLGAEYQYGTLDSNVTITFSNEADGRSVTLFLTYDGTAQRTITWSDVDEWANGEPPDAPSATNRETIVTLVRVNTTTYGFHNTSFVTTGDTGTINFIIDGGGSAITTGIKGFLQIDFDCTINSVTLLADQSGSIVVDIWKDTYGNYPPTDADSITASAVPTISSAVKATDATLTGWTTSITSGNILGFNVDSITTCQRVTLSLKVTRTV